MSRAIHKTGINGRAAKQPLPAIITIHDVMPETMPGVRAIIEFMEKLRLPPAMLLVSPGKGWDRDGLSELRELSRSGHPLCGHGWRHTAPQIGSLYHRFHAFFMSRQAAEHLSFSRAEICTLMRNCSDWFAEHNLPPPDYYVPPAWAMGKVSHADLKTLPYRFYETISGIYDSQKHCFSKLPLAGFEADTALRAIFLRVYNAVNYQRAYRTHQPLRIAIHPHDLDLCLGQDLCKLLNRQIDCVSYKNLNP